MGKSQRFVLKQEDSLEGIVAAVMDFLEKEKKMVSETVIQPSGYFLQTKSKDTWKSLVGMSLATHILFERSGENLSVTVNNGKWIDKIAVAGIGFATPLAAITVATAAFGAWNQQKLPGEIFDEISRIIRFGVPEATDAVYRKVLATAAPDDIYNLADKTASEDKEKSIILYRLAAEGNSAKGAAIELGRRYYDGDGVERDLRKAFEFWNRNIEALDAETALKLADMYRDGEVTEKNLKKAFSLYKKAPRQDAESRIMEIFNQGVDLPEYTRYAAESYVRRLENGEGDLLDKIIELYTSLNDSEKLKKYQIIAAQKGDRTLAAKWGKELFKTDTVVSHLFG